MDLVHTSAKRSGKLMKMLAWTSSVLSCAYFVWTYAALSHYTRVFSDMYESMGLETNALIGFVLRHYHGLYGALFSMAGILVIAKEIHIKDKRLSLLSTLLGFLMVVSIVQRIEIKLNEPLLEYVERLNR